VDTYASISLSSGLARLWLDIADDDEEVVLDVLDIEDTVGRSLLGGGGGVECCARA
jgi:hypothetical protein